MIEMKLRDFRNYAIKTLVKTVDSRVRRVEWMEWWVKERSTKVCVGSTSRNKHSFNCCQTFSEFIQHCWKKTILFSERNWRSVRVKRQKTQYNNTSTCWNKSLILYLESVLLHKISLCLPWFTSISKFQDFYCWSHLIDQKNLRNAFAVCYILVKHNPAIYLVFKIHIL